MRNGSFSNSSLIGTFCGNSLPNPIFPKNNVLHLLFKSDALISYKGYEITWTSSPSGKKLLDNNYYMCVKARIQVAPPTFRIFYFTALGVPTSLFFLLYTSLFSIGLWSIYMSSWILYLYWLQTGPEFCRESCTPRSRSLMPWANRKWFD